MNKFAKRILLTLIVFLSCIVIGFSMICIVYMLPSDRVSLHVRESGEILEAEGDYHRLIPTSSNTVLDNFTDCIMMLTSAYDGNESVIDKTVNNYRVYQKKASKQESCKVCGLLAEENSKKYPYAQYWHGYMVVLKPLLTFFHINEIRQINQFALLFCICLISILLYVHKKSRYLIPFLLAVSFLNPAAIANSLQNSTIFYISCVSVIILLALWKQSVFSGHLWIYFMIVGMVTSYVDFLTYPVVALAFPLIFFFILNEEDHFLSNMKHLLGYSIMWCIGYAGMWSSKWILSTVLTGKDYITYALQKLTERSGSTVGEQTITLTDVYQSLTSYLTENKLWICTLIFIVLCLIILALSSKEWKRWSVSLVFLLIALYPFIWSVGTKNHTYMHNMFTHRGLSVLIFALSCAVLPVIGRPLDTIRKKIHTL